ncbi:MAG: tetratricopeptide repeat protein [Alistipes sp.]|nr:tetratricopeptide repeat protein [Alistipes sp.]
MAKKNVAEPEALGQAMSKTELFFENNGRKMTYIFLALVVLGVAIFGYRQLIVQPRVEKAAALLSEAQARFNVETPDFELALNGDENGAGFLDVIDQYGSTPSGNLATHYAGICYLRTGDLESAASYLKKFSTLKGVAGEMINAQNYGLQGDIAVEQGDLKKAVSLYNKAVAAADNQITAPLYLRKAGMAEQAAGNAEAAKGYYEKIKTEYPASFEARDAEKLIGTIH